MKIVDIVRDARPIGASVDRHRLPSGLECGSKATSDYKFCLADRILTNDEIGFFKSLLLLHLKKVQLFYSIDLYCEYFS